MPEKTTYKTKIRELLALEETPLTGMQANKVSKFAYTEVAYTQNKIQGTDTFDNKEDQNIPNGTPEIIEANNTIINKGYRTQGSTIGRMVANHFFGRTSYNLNKIHDWFTEFMKNFMTQFANHAIWDLQALDTPEVTDFDTMVDSGTYKGEDFVSMTAYPEWFDQNGGPTQYGKWSCVVECGKGYRRQYLYYTRIAGATELQGNYLAIRTMTETPEGDIDDYGTWTSKSVEADHALQADQVLPDGVKIILDLAHPKGDYYWTDDKNFDPNVSWVGTWVRVEDTFIYAIKENETAGVTGGSKFTIINYDNLPPHQHYVSLTGGSHTHTYPTLTWAGTSNDAIYGGTKENPPINTFTFTGGSHSHSGTTMYNSTSSGNSRNNKPKNTPLDNMPPYVGAYCWHRTE